MLVEIAYFYRCELRLNLLKIYMHFETLHGEISCIVSNFGEHLVSFLNDFIKNLTCGPSDSDRRQRQNNNSYK